MAGQEPSQLVGQKASSRRCRPAKRRAGRTHLPLGALEQQFYGGAGMGGTQEFLLLWQRQAGATQRGKPATRRAVRRGALPGSVAV